MAPRKLRELDGRSALESMQISPRPVRYHDRAQLAANSDIAFMGDTKGGAFDIAEEQALKMLNAPNPHGQPNTDVIVPWVNGLDVTRRTRHMFIIDFGTQEMKASARNMKAHFSIRFCT